MSTPPLTARLRQSAQAASQVLEAERDALEGIAHCERQMQRLGAESRALAERVRRRTEARIARMCERMQAAVQQREERIAAEMTQLATLPEPDAAAPAALDQAIARTIDELIGTSESG